ncbi:hypothetical protein [Bacteroides sp. UBA939]|uniref:hypothetical protein n=1 Tax=Bacteroides sp. UBA939 TaxID=1946092 RepID=UPI0025C3E6D0|nr:hypothetical protein [Bacteroides sp. UBA939]
MNTKYTLSAVILAFMMTSMFVACGVVNSNSDLHFTKCGFLIKDSTDISPQTDLSNIKFYVEVSGSMNGFFRANKPTKFKEDVWRICSYYKSFSHGVTILTNDGNSGDNISMTDFQTRMNTGSFVSTASTRVPVMLQSIISNLDTSRGEVAVLISDMKYSPVGTSAPQVLLTQYSTDVSKILGDFSKPISLICATSDYLKNSGNPVTDRSPYYYFIIGNSGAVAKVRDGISTLLEDNGSFIDNIESGFDYGAPNYSFGIPNKCYQLDNEPTFLQYEEPDGIDSCTIKLKVDLAPYRWLLTNKDYFIEAFKVKTLYGSNIIVGDIDIAVQNKTDKKLKRTATATVELKVVNMATDSEVLEWSLELPDTDYTLFGEFCGATMENDYTKSYSIENFIKGIFYGGIVNQSLKPNYILVSKKD